MHLIALLELLSRICVFAHKHLNILVQICTGIFIHDRKQEEELLIHTSLLNSIQTLWGRGHNACSYTQLTAQKNQCQYHNMMIDDWPDLYVSLHVSK